MIGIDCSFFQTQTSDDLLFYFESSEGVVDSYSLYLSRKSKVYSDVVNPLLASIQVISGTMADGIGDLILESSRIEVNHFGGYISDPLEESGYFIFSTQFNEKGEVQHASHLVVDTGFSYSIHLTFLQGYLDEDIHEIANYLALAKFKPALRPAIFGDYLDFELSESSSISRIGDRFLLNPV